MTKPRKSTQKNTKSILIADRSVTIRKSVVKSIKTVKVASDIYREIAPIIIKNNLAIDTANFSIISLAEENSRYPNNFV